MESRRELTEELEYLLDLKQFLQSNISKYKSSLNQFEMMDDLLKIAPIKVKRTAKQRVTETNARILRDTMLASLAVFEGELLLCTTKIDQVKQLLEA